MKNAAGCIARLASEPNAITLLVVVLVVGARIGGIVSSTGVIVGTATNHNALKLPAGLVHNLLRIS
jgi:hypothetical protein